MWLLGSIPVPDAVFVKPGDDAFELPFGFPVIVKPNFGDSSFGITTRSVANTIEQVGNAISEIRIARLKWVPKSN